MSSPEISELAKKIIPEFGENLEWDTFRDQVTKSGFKPIAEGARQLLDMRVTQVRSSWKDSFSGANTSERALAL